MAQELADLFAGLYGAGLARGLRTVWGTVTQVSPLRVRLDAMDTGDIGPLAAIRALPALGERVLLFEVPGTRDYVVLGTQPPSFVVPPGGPCPEGGTPCVNYHWPTDTVYGPYTLAADFTPPPGTTSYDAPTQTQSLGPGDSSTNGQHFALAVPAGMTTLRVTTGNAVPADYSGNDADLALFAPGAWDGALSWDTFTWPYRSSTGGTMQESITVTSPAAGTWDAVFAPSYMPDSVQYDFDWHYDDLTPPTEHSQLVIAVPISDTMNYQRIEFANVAGTANADVRMYCPGQWTGSIATSGIPALINSNQGYPGANSVKSLYLFNSIRDSARIDFNPTGRAGNWTMVLAGTTVASDVTFDLALFGRECSGPPSSVICVSQSAAIPAGPLETRAAIVFQFTPPPHCTSIDFAYAWDDRAALAAYDPALPDKVQLRLYYPDDYRANGPGMHLPQWDYVLKGTSGFDLATSSPGPLSVPFTFARGGSFGNQVSKVYQSARGFRLDWPPAGLYTLLFATDDWNYPGPGFPFGEAHPPFSSGVTLTATCHVDYGAVDGVGWEGQ